MLAVADSADSIDYFQHNINTRSDYQHCQQVCEVRVLGCRADGVGGAGPLRGGAGPLRGGVGPRYAAVSGRYAAANSRRISRRVPLRGTAALPPCKALF